MGPPGAPLCVRKQATMIKRPNHERFDMSQKELMAFWYIIIREYSQRYVRENSTLLYNNNSPMVRNEDA